jgi:hypothetical protein
MDANIVKLMDFSANLQSIRYAKLTLLVICP